MADAGGGVDGSFDPVRNTHGNPLSFAGRIAKTIHDRISTLGQDAGGAVIAFLEGGRLPFDQTTGAIVVMMIQKPGLAEDTGSLGFDDMVVLDGQFDVIADTSAKRAACVLNDFQFTRDRLRGRVCIDGRLRHGKITLQ